MNKNRLFVELTTGPAHPWSEVVLNTTWGRALRGAKMGKGRQNEGGIFEKFFKVIKQAKIAFGKICRPKILGLKKMRGAKLP